MSIEREPLAAVPGLSRTAKVPPPPPRRVRPAERIHPGPSTDHSPSATPSPAGPQARTRPSATPHQAASASAEIMRAVTLSLPASLVALVRARARADQVSQPEVLMDALAASQDRLDELLEAAVAPPRSDGLFLRRATQHVPAEPMATLSLRLLAPNLEAIDNLATDHEAPSRSALCAAALLDYLTDKDSSAPR